MKHKGFTLIELLIVISIIAILSVIALVSFAGITRSMKLDNVTDMLVSAINQQKGLVKTGKVDADSNGQTDVNNCQGIRFSVGSTDNNGVPVKLIKTTFKTISDDKLKANVCSTIDSANLTDYTSVSDYKISGITVYDQKQQQVDLVFKPPFAAVEISSKDSGLVLQPLKSLQLNQAKNNSSIIKLDLQAKGGDISKLIKWKPSEQVLIEVSSVTNPDEKQYIIFDPQSGLAYKSPNLPTASS